MTLAAAPLLAAAGVALGHAVLPDHWVPLAVIGRTRRYPLRRIARLSSLAGIAHVLVSLMLGTVIIVIGLQFRSRIESAQDTVVGLLLIGTGVAFAVLELAGRGHGHPDGQEHTHRDESGAHRSRFHALAGIAVPFGAAASPDLTILPVFLAATTAGTGAAVGSLVVFAVVTIATIVGLTVAAAAGGYQLRASWLERWGNAFTAAVLITLGALVLAGAL